MSAKRKRLGHPSFLSCGEHRSWRDECAECAEMVRLYREGRPQTMNHPKARTEGEAEQVAATVDELQGSDLAAMARRCEQMLAAHHGDTIEVRPEEEP